MPYIFLNFTKPAPPEPITMPKKLRTMKIRTVSGKELLLTHARTRSYPGTNTYGAYGGLVHAMRRGAAYPTKSRTFLTQLCVPVNQAELDFGESFASYHAENIEDDVTPTCKKCLKILSTATPV